MIGLLGGMKFDRVLFMGLKLCVGNMRVLVSVS